MANIMVRKENESKATPATAAGIPAWEPFRMMRDLMGWDPFREMVPALAMPQIGGGFAPSFEVKETKDAYVFKSDVPGVKENDLDVTLTNNRLTVSGKRDAEHQEQTDTYYAYERSYGSFTRSFTLPDGVDDGAVAAELKDGVLTLTLKKRPEMQPKKIAINPGAKKS